MDTGDVMDALQVHALAAAAAANAAFTDVAVGFPAAKGRCVRIFYGGEREPAFFETTDLKSRIVADAVMVRAHWPVASTAAADQRDIELEMVTFAHQFRTRVHGDYTLGGDATALEMPPASANQTVIARTRYSVLEFEVVVDHHEYTTTP